MLQSWSVRGEAESQDPFYVASGRMCFGNQRAFRVLQSWSVREKGARTDWDVLLANFKLRVGDVFRKSAGIPGVAVLVCASKRGARTDEHFPVHLA